MCVGSMFGSLAVLPLPKLMVDKFEKMVICVPLVCGSNIDQVWEVSFVGGLHVLIYGVEYHKWACHLIEHVGRVQATAMQVALMISQQRLGPRQIFNR